MIGIVRLGLALVVMAGHTGAISILWSRFAVLGFYGLAGYFGAMSLNRSGRASFLLSRYGRVWPTFAVVFLACSAALWLGFEPRLGAMGLPLWENWLRQALLIPASAPYVVASAWMLPHMMMGWAGLAIVGQSRRMAWGWLGLGLALLIDLQAWPWTDWYYGILYAQPWFALGAMAYLLGVRVGKEQPISAMAGEISYPLFLAHYAVAAAIPASYGWPLFFAALAPTRALSWLLVVAVERPVQTFRQQLRANHGN